MIENVLVPMDDSDMATRALEFALEAYPEAEVTVLHVVGVPSPFMADAMSLAMADDIEELADERAADVFDRAQAIADEQDRAIQTQVAIGKPTRAIVSRAEGHDVVVMGAHGRNVVNRLFLGNVAEAVTRRSPTPVTVVR